MACGMANTEEDPENLQLYRKQKKTVSLTIFEAQRDGEDAPILWKQEGGCQTVIERTVQGPKVIVMGEEICAPEVNVSCETDCEVDDPSDACASDGEGGACPVEGTLALHPEGYKVGCMEEGESFALVYEDPVGRGEVTGALGGAIREYEVPEMRWGIDGLGDESSGWFDESVWHVPGGHSVGGLGVSALESSSNWTAQRIESDFEIQRIGNRVPVTFTFTYSVQPVDSEEAEIEEETQALTAAETTLRVEVRAAEGTLRVLERITVRIAHQAA